MFNSTQSRKANDTTSLGQTEELSRGTVLLMFLFVAFTLLLRLLFLGAKPLWLDEAKMVMLAAQSPATIFIGAAGDIHPPAGYFFLHFWQQLFGMSEFAVRLPSALFISFALVPIFLAGRRIFGAKPFVWLGIIFALSPYTLYVGQEARTYAYTGFFCAWLFYFAVLVTQGYGWRGYLGFGLASLGALHSHHLTATLVGVLAIYLVIYEIINRRKRWWWVIPLVTLGLTFIIYLPQMLFTIAQIRLFAGEVGEIQGGGSTLPAIVKCSGGALFHMGSGFYFNAVDAYTLPRIFAQPFVATIFVISMILPIVILFFGVLSWAKLEPRYRWLVAFAFIVPWLVSGYFLGSARHFIVILPAYVLLIAMGIERLFRRNLGRILVGSLLLLYIFTDVEYYARPTMPTTHHYVRNFRDVGNFLKQNARSGDLIYLHLDPYSVLNSEYYLDEAPAEVDSYYRDYHYEHIIHNQAKDYMSKVDLWGKIDAALAAGRNVWLVANDPHGVYDPQMSPRTGEFNLGVDSDKACDIRLFDLEKHYPQARIAYSPGEILRMFYIPMDGGW